MANTPECNKMLGVRDKSQTIGEFIEWMQEQDIYFAAYHEHSDDCYDDDGFLICGLREDMMVTHVEPMEMLLARFFEIDLDKVEEEKRAILEELQNE